MAGYSGTPLAKKLGITERAMPAGRTGCYPGTFNPPTIAHLAVAEAALAAGHLDRVDLVVSQISLGKEDLADPPLAERLALLHHVASARPWLAVVVRHARLVADLAAGYDAVIMGADKWHQVNDPAWYDHDLTRRDGALARLPEVLVAPRAHDELSELRGRPGVTVLSVGSMHRLVSAAAIRAGQPGSRAWIPPEVTAFNGSDTE